MAALSWLSDWMPCSESILSNAARFRESKAALDCDEHDAKTARTVCKGVASRPEDMLEPSLARRVHDIKTSEKEVARMSGIYARRIEEGREEGRKEGAAFKKHRSAIIEEYGLGQGNAPVR